MRTESKSGLWLSRGMVQLTLGPVCPIACMVNGVAAHHQYTMWWNGDFRVRREHGGRGSTRFPDCGSGEVSRSGTAVLRWTAHCVLGTILRFHGAVHSPWLFDNNTQATIRRYLQMRYALAPLLISAGQINQQHGLPLAARCDLFWPEFEDARSNNQYVTSFADALVAPLAEEQMEQAVWIHPGEWEDAWDGTRLTGPLVKVVINMSKLFSQIPK